MIVKSFPSGSFQTESISQLCNVPSGPLQTNSILVICHKTKETAIVDPAFDAESSIFEYIEEEGLKITKVLITHSHWDHISGLNLIKEKYSVPVFVHKDDSKNITNPGTDGLSALFSVEGNTVDHFLSDGDVIKVGNIELQVIHTPGHSPGSVCFYNAEDGFLISGDTLFKGSMGNISLPTAEPERMWPSLEKLSNLPPETKVFPGHGPSTAIGEEPWLADAKSYFG